MNVEVKRPVFVCGENPAVSLFSPETKQLVAVASFWQITYSAYGPGNALVLWLAENALPGSQFSPSGIFSDNIPLAKLLVNSLTRHFSEFRTFDVAALPYIDAICRQTHNGAGNYTVNCHAETLRIVVEWAEPLDQKMFVIRQLPAGENIFDLINVTCPCRSGSINVAGVSVRGEVQVTTEPNGDVSSTAFLAFAETWLGPFPKDIPA
jgi:hypothetical protein